RKKNKMFAWINKFLDWIRSLFWKEEMELTLVGLQYSGKTTFVNVIASGHFHEDMIPTVGFNMKKITKGNVTIKLWDIGGQPRFRSMWERYCRGVNAVVYVLFIHFFNYFINSFFPILNYFFFLSRRCFQPIRFFYMYSIHSYVVDAADHEKFETTKKELHELMSKPPLAGIPLLVLANKNDLADAVGVHEIIETLYVPLYIY